MSIPTIKIGDDNWAVKPSLFLGYNDTNGIYIPREFTVSRGTTASEVNSAGILTTANNNIARIDYLNFAKGALFVEASAQNLALRSDEFRTIAEGGPSNAWTANDTVIVSVNNLSPDGTNNATRIRGAASPTNRARQQIITGTSGVAYVGSAWIRRVSGTSPITLRVGDVGTTTNISPTSTWQRYSFSSTPTTTTVRIAFLFPNDTDEFEIWGAQLETGAIATSYISTTTGIGSRAADTISLSNVSNLIGQTEGVLYIECESNDGVDDVFFINRSVANGIVLYKSANNAYLGRIHHSSNTITFQSSNNVSGMVKIAIAYKSGDSTMYLNGSQVGTTNTTAITFGAELNSLGVNKNPFFSGAKPSRIRAAAVYTSRLSNDNLMLLTLPTNDGYLPTSIWNYYLSKPGVSEVSDCLYERYFNILNI